MNCVKPVNIFDKKTAGSMSVPCGRCIACRLNYASEWSLRMMNEKKYHDESCFVTLTYADDKLPVNGSLVKKDVQKFFKRLRKNTGKKLRYYVGGEYGDNLSRPHYHCIIYGIGKDTEEKIDRAWDNGFIFVGDVTADSCNYVAKYVVKKQTGDKKKVYDEKGVIPEFSLMSRNPGIGGDFVKQYSREIAERGFMLNKGSRVGVPRFYKGKMSPREVLLLEQKGQRFVLGLHKKEVSRISEIGYKENDKNKVNSRLALENKLRGRFNLKVRS